MGELGGYKVGQVIQLQNEIVGTIRWLGQGEFAEGDWVGLELEDASGKNNGMVKGKRYFSCPENHGMMVRPVAIASILEEPPEPPAKTASTKRTSVGNGTSGKAATSRPSRPSSLVAPTASRKPTVADPTTKRSSINAASPTPAGRVAAARSTSSPTKPVGTRPTSLTAAARAPATTVKPTAASTASGVASKRTSLVGRTPPISTIAGSRTARSSTVGSAFGSTNGVLRSQTSTGAKKPTDRIAVLQRSDRTSSANSRVVRGTEEEPSVGDSSTGKGANASEQAEQTKDNRPRKSSLPGQALLSPPLAVHEANTPGLSRPTTQSLQAQNRKIEDLETKLRVIEKQRLEDKEKLKDMEKVTNEKNKFEGIIQKLQTKIQPQAQEISELRKELKEVELKLKTAEGQQSEVDEAIELATLDREMAEEMAETYKAELDILRNKHEELVLETEILRAENEDLGREMSPEERSSAGVAQLEKSNERYREALVRLRDITQDTEAQLKAQIDELENDSSELIALKGKYDDTRQELERAEGFNEELKSQLETAQGAEEMIEELTEKNMGLTEQMQGLKSAIEDLESLREINDELELNHIENERAMQDEIDYRDALLLEQSRRSSEQDEVVEELEYTVSRFREVVANLNSDLEDLRASQQITEAEANELSSKSKAMMDLNLRLQQSASKTQVKVIDAELKRLEAQESADHLSIAQKFLPDSYAMHRDSVSAFLGFKRISFKASIVHSFVKERVNGVAVPGHEEDIFAACDVLDRLIWISSMCNRFARLIVSCSLDVFAQIGNVIHDLDPVERTFNGWIESLKRDELKERQCAADLQRTMSVFEHLGERYLGQGLADFAEEVHMRAMVLQSNLDTAASALVHIKAIAQARVVLPSDADEEDEEDAQAFLNKADNVVAQVRSVKVVAGKALHQLRELQSRSLTLDPSAQATIDTVQGAVRSLAVSTRASGIAVAALVNEEARVDSLTFDDIIHSICESDSTPFSTLTNNIGSVSMAVQSFNNLTATLSQTVEFESPDDSSLSAVTTPWSQIAAKLRAESESTSGREAEIARLHDQLSERGTALALKDKHLSELNVSVEVLEKRVADSGKAIMRIREIEELLAQAEHRERELCDRLEDRESELEVLRAQRDSLRTDTQQFDNTDSQGIKGTTEAVVGSLPPDSVPLKAAAEIAALKDELEATQASVRMLRQAAIETSFSAAEADGVLTPFSMFSASAAERSDTVGRERSARSIFKTLRSITGRDAEGIVTLKKSDQNERLKWRSAKDTVSWRVGHRREEWEAWKEWVEELAHNEKGEMEKQQRIMKSKRNLNKKVSTAEPKEKANVLARLDMSGLPPFLAGKQLTGEIRIVDPLEWEDVGKKLGLAY